MNGVYIAVGIWGVMSVAIDGRRYHTVSLRGNQERRCDPSSNGYPVDFLHCPSPHPNRRLRTMLSWRRLSLEGTSSFSYDGS